MLIEMDDDELDKMFPDGQATMSELTKDVLSVEQKDGYEIREELVTFYFNDDEQVQITKSAYAPDGGYIGRPEDAQALIKRGIAPELAYPDKKHCAIGFSEREQKWYGWSHRAIYGFAIGYVAEEGHIVTESGWTDEYLAEHPEEDVSVPVGFEAKTLDDCKTLAIAFAESVS